MGGAVSWAGECESGRLHCVSSAPAGRWQGPGGCRIPREKPGKAHLPPAHQLLWDPADLSGCPAAQLSPAEVTPTAAPERGRVGRMEGRDALPDPI